MGGLGGLQKAKRYLMTSGGGETERQRMAFNLVVTFFLLILHTKRIFFLWTRKSLNRVFCVGEWVSQDTLVRLTWIPALWAPLSLQRFM